MNYKFAKSILVAGSLALIVTACSNGGSSGSGAPEPSADAFSEVAVTGSAVKGPIANGEVAAYVIDWEQPDLKGRLISEGTTDSQARIQGVYISTNRAARYVLLEVSGGTDLFSGDEPLVSPLRTILSLDDLDAGIDVFATPLTTLAVDLAAVEVDVAQLSNSNNAIVGERDLLLGVQTKVKNVFGFGLLDEIDQAGEIFTASPLIDSTDPAEQSAALAYRVASEGFAALLVDLKDSGADADSELTKILAEDLQDGAIDGQIDNQPIDALAMVANVTEVLTQDPASLKVPGTDILITDIAEALVEENERLAINITIADVVIENAEQPVTLVPGDDRDGDGVIDQEDAFPDNPDESLDSDGDGFGDNSDAYPNDPNGQVLSDLDQDLDGVLDTEDAFPADPTETSDRDVDGVGDNADLFPDNSLETVDTDGDCGAVPQPGEGAGNQCGDNSDEFPNNENEQVDSDGDCILFFTPDQYLEVTGGSGCADNSDAFPLDDSEQLDSDEDGVGDNSDTFPNDDSETADTDGDGVGDNADWAPEDDAIQVICQDPSVLDVDKNAAGCFVDSDNDGVNDPFDAFPNDSSETQDSDSDGVGDNADVFPNDSTETLDTDSDGVGDNSDAFPSDPAETADSDLDGVGDNADAFPQNPDEAADADNDCTDAAYAIYRQNQGFANDPSDSDYPNLIDSGDGCGDNSDEAPNDFGIQDDDLDGVLNSDDLFPQNASESADWDGDCGAGPFNGASDGNGCGDNSDADIDDDGVANALDIDDFNDQLGSDCDGDGVTNLQGDVCSLQSVVPGYKDITLNATNPSFLSCAGLYPYAVDLPPFIPYLNFAGASCVDIPDLVKLEVSDTHVVTNNFGVFEGSITGTLTGDVDFEVLTILAGTDNTFGTGDDITQVNFRYQGTWVIDTQAETLIATNVVCDEAPQGVTPSILVCSASGNVNFLAGNSDGSGTGGVVLDIGVYQQGDALFIGYEVGEAVPGDPSAAYITFEITY